MPDSVTVRLLFGMIISMGCASRFCVATLGFESRVSWLSTAFVHMVMSIDFLVVHALGGPTPCGAGGRTSTPDS